MGIEDFGGKVKIVDPMYVCEESGSPRLSAEFYEAVGMKAPVMTKENEQQALGEAWLEEDGTITLQMRRDADGNFVSAKLQYRQSDTEYAKVLHHLGGLEKGEVKLVMPWPD